MDIEALFKHPAFSQLLPDQMQLFRQFARDIQGKSSTEIARLYMHLNQQVTKIAPLSASQRKGIVDAVQSFLPASERSKLTGFLGMLGR